MDPAARGPLQDLPARQSGAGQLGHLGIWRDLQHQRVDLVALNRAFQQDPAADFPLRDLGQVKDSRRQAGLLAVGLTRKPGVRRAGRPGHPCALRAGQGHPRHGSVPLGRGVQGEGGEGLKLQRAPRQDQTCCSRGSGHGAEFEVAGRSLDAQGGVVDDSDLVVSPASGQEAEGTLLLIDGDGPSVQGDLIQDHSRGQEGYLLPAAGLQAQVDPAVDHHPLATRLQRVASVREEVGSGWRRRGGGLGRRRGGQAQVLLQGKGDRASGPGLGAQCRGGHQAQGQGQQDPGSHASPPCPRSRETSQDRFR